MKHLNCRQCGKILKPVNQTNYSYYRVNRFICDNEQCGNRDEIYLSHCLTKNCPEVIDSRDMAKCPNGLIICSRCDSCCSTALFARRINSLEMNGQPIPKRLVELVEKNLGHADQGLKFCFKCGSPLKGGIDTYLKVLNWLIDNKDKNVKIKKSNKRKDNKWWFIVDFPLEKYVELEKMGFQVKKQDSGSFYLISEPFDKNWEGATYCTNENCSNHAGKEKIEEEDYL